jgi:hypothetical protein
MIRPFERGDVAEVASLYEHVIRSGSRTPAPGLARYFERTLLDHPWFDHEIPSLVYEDHGGKIAGFVGSHVRRMRLDNRLIRVACGGELIVDPLARRQAAGMHLIRAYHEGPQDVTVTDGATGGVRRLLEFCGSEVSYPRSLLWTRILRPAWFIGNHLLRKFGMPRLAEGLGPALGALDLLGLKRLLRPPAPQAEAEPLTVQLLLANLPSLATWLRCYPAYDESFLEWLFREMAAVTSRGSLIRTLVRSPRGEALGWYLYYLKAGAISEVMQVAAKARAAEPVLDHLFHHAYTHGAMAVRGRLEPELVAPLSARHCIFRWDGGTLIHTRTPALMAILLSRQCLLTRMDGEWWMGHHTEPFQ